MQTLRGIISEAEAKKVAVGHFNFSNLEGFRAIVNAARNLSLPVVVGLSEGERDFVGFRYARALVDAAREETGLSIFLNADHTYSFEKVKAAIDDGADLVIFDGAKLPFEENVAIATRCVAYARASEREVLVEGELGYIGSSSAVLDEIPEGASVTKDLETTPEEALRFVKETGVDLLAPAVGELHGILKHAANPALDIERVAEIRASAGAPLVLHGGSGISDDDFRAAIAAGVSVVHINTELRIAYRDALARSLADRPDDIAPYRLLAPAVAAMERVVESRLRLFNGL